MYNMHVDLYPSIVFKFRVGFSKIMHAAQNTYTHMTHVIMLLYLCQINL